VGIGFPETGTARVIQNTSGMTLFIDPVDVIVFRGFGAPECWIRTVAHSYSFLLAEHPNNSLDSGNLFETS